MATVTSPPSSLPSQSPRPAASWPRPAPPSLVRPHQQTKRPLAMVPLYLCNVLATFVYPIALKLALSQQPPPTLGFLSHSLLLDRLDLSRSPYYSNKRKTTVSMVSALPGHLAHSATFISGHRALTHTSWCVHCQCGHLHVRLTVRLVQTFMFCAVRTCLVSLT